MQSGSYWAFREAAELPDYEQDIPVVKVLWSKVHTARRPHLCTACGEGIAPGTVYRSQGFLVDDVFETSKLHGAVGGYPSACPKFAELDRKELADQFEADRQRYFPTSEDDATRKASP
jgi:hypothetical protein